MQKLKQMISPEPYPMIPSLGAEPPADVEAPEESWIRELQKRTYISLRYVMTVISILLPFVFLISAYWVGMQNSISAFYYTIMQDVFVGALFTLGICLFIYKGYNPLENTGLTVAGILLFFLALIPTTAPEGTTVSVPWYFPWIHVGIAYLFFGLIAIVCIFARKNRLVDSAEYNSVYNIIAWLMGLVILAAVVLFLLKKFGVIEFRTSTFWVETGAIWVFAGYWFTKSRELGTLG